MDDQSGEEKLVVSGYVRESTKGALQDEATRRSEMLRGIVGATAPKVSVSAVVEEIIENWRKENEAKARAAAEVQS